MTKHYLKIEKPYFEAVLSGDKTFEVRYNDRAFQKGDTVILQEIDLTKTGREVEAQISYILTDVGLKENYVAFGLKNIKRND